jgi:hypothetical protein
MSLSHVLESRNVQSLGKNHSRASLRPCVTRRFIREDGRRSRHGKRAHQRNPAWPCKRWWNEQFDRRSEWHRKRFQIRSAAPAAHICPANSEVQVRRDCRSSWAAPADSTDVVGSSLARKPHMPDVLTLWIRAGMDILDPEGPWTRCISACRCRLTAVGLAKSHFNLAHAFAKQHQY